MALEVLVTGGSGVLGRQICQDLRQAGHRVQSCHREAGAGVDAVWDVSTQSSPTPHRPVEVVVHAAARIGRYQHSLSDSQELFDTNLTGTLRVAQWCHSAGVRRLVLISGAIVYGHWENAPKRETDIVQPWRAGAYAVSKSAGEQVARLLSKCEVSILRLSSLYGPGYSRGLIQRMLRQGRSEGFVRVTSPFDTSYDLLHIVDASRATRRAVENPNWGLWNIGGGRLTTILEVGQACAHSLGVPLILDEGEEQTGSMILNWVDDHLARRDLGHENTITMEQGIDAIRNQS